MLREEAHAIVNRLLAAASARDIRGVMDCYTEGAVALSPVFGELRGRKAIADAWERLFQTFADLEVEVGDILVDADRVAALSTIRTIDRVGWFGLRPTGSPIVYRLVLVLTISDGRIARDERLYDSGGVVERLEKARIDKELRTAADVQRALLPRTSIATSVAEIVGDSVPCRAIGGDFFDVAPLPDGNIGILIGDVSGKGPAAALLAALVQGILAADPSAARSPAAAVKTVNDRLLARGFESRFATLVYGMLTRDRRFIYCNAGHNPPVLLSGAARGRLTIGGPIVGALRHARFEEETLDLGRGDTVVLFTDGATDARDVSDREFGEERLLAAVDVARDELPASILARAFGAVRDFAAGAEPADDITLAVIRVR